MASTSRPLHNCFVSHIELLKVVGGIVFSKLKQLLLNADVFIMWNMKDSSKDTAQEGNPNNCLISITIDSEKH